MEVLIIGYVWPEPNSSAAGSRMMQLIEAFRGRGWTVTFATPAAASEHAVDLSQMGVGVAEISLNCSSFDEFIGELAPDVVLFDRFMMEEQFGWRVAKVCPGALRVLDTEDLHCLRDARHRALKQGRSFELLELNSELALREVAAIFRSDLTLMISSFEMALLKDWFGVPERILHYCPFMLDLTGIGGSAPEFSMRQHFISIGSFRHAPNWDAVLWLNGEIWPLIRRQLPEAQLHIYGSYPPPKATALHNPAKGFWVQGWADNAKAVMRQARVCLAPLRFGAGIKGKLSEAMVCGTPSVTTAIGAEGMCIDAGWPGAVAESARQIADAAVELYQNEARWQQAQALGYRTLGEKFDREQLVPQLIRAIERCREGLELHRRSNFIGSMLNHHHHRSTQYMSQWIEAKNKKTAQ